MTYDVLNIDAYCELNKLPEVTESSMWDSKLKEPNANGIASYELFGRPGSDERKRVFAYISLNDYFIHPHVYNELIRLQRNLEDLFNGVSDFYIENGVLVKMKEGEELSKNVKRGSGAGFLYNNWNNIDWKPRKGQAISTYERRKFISSLKKEEVFMTKWLVNPPFYRDVDIQTGTKNLINKLYNRIINNASSIKSTKAVFQIFGVTPAHIKIQQTINEIYDMFIVNIGGYKGYIHKHVMGKATDFAARCVISMPRYDKQNIKDQEVSFTHSAVPLAIIIKAAAPFISFGVRQIVNKILSGSDFIYLLEKGQLIRTELSPLWKDVISSDNIMNLIDLYYQAQEHRLDYFKLPGKDGTMIPLMIIRETEEEFNDVLENKTQPITLCELFYMAAYDTLGQPGKEKVIYTTRYPIEDMNNIYPSIANIIPCNDYETKTVFDNHYPRYPIFPKNARELNPRTFFTDTMKVFPSYLKALGGDYDGDTVSLQIPFTNEANNDARKYILSKTNIMDVGGGTMREIPELSQLGGYMLTYKHPKP